MDRQIFSSKSCHHSTISTWICLQFTMPHSFQPQHSWHIICVTFKWWIECKLNAVLQAKKQLRSWFELAPVMSVPADLTFVPRKSTLSDHRSLRMYISLHLVHMFSHSSVTNVFCFCSCIDFPVFSTMGSCATTRKNTGLALQIWRTEWWMREFSVHTMIFNLFHKLMSLMGETVWEGGCWKKDGERKEGLEGGKLYNRSFKMVRSARKYISRIWRQ